MNLNPLLPWWLIALVTAPVMGVLGYAAWRAWPRGHSARLEAFARLGMTLALTLILLHPGVGRTEVARSGTQLDVVFVLDRTTSMSALDGPNQQERLDGAREDMSAIANSLAGSRFSLITFGRRTQLEMPFTTDLNAVQAAIESVRREEPLDGFGSALDRPLPQLESLLERTAEARPERQRIVIFLSDGEVTEQPQGTQSYAPLESLASGGLVIGYGTTAGGRMVVSEEDTDREFVVDQDTGAEALSKYNPAPLRAIAEQAGLEFIHRTAPGQVAPRLDSIERGTSALGDSTPARHDLTWLWGALLLGCALVEVRRLIREAQDALAQRRALDATTRDTGTENPPDGATGSRAAGPTETQIHSAADTGSRPIDTAGGVR